MKIVHQFYSKKAQTSGSGDAYATRIDSMPPKKMRGFQVDLLAVDVGKDGSERDALHLEGDGEAVKAMLLSMLRVVRLIESGCRKDYARTRAQTKKCKGCGCWFAHKHSCSKFKHIGMKKQRKKGS